jgi:hypothetical protein
MAIPALIGLLIAAQIPGSLLARSDEANAAYVQCLFSVVRAANAAKLSQSAFEQRLSNACRAEGQVQRALGVRILKLRGEPRPEQSVDRTDWQIRQGMIDDYRKMPEKQRALEQLEALCRGKPQQCR